MEKKKRICKTLLVKNSWRTKIFWLPFKPGSVCWTPSVAKPLQSFSTEIKAEFSEWGNCSQFLFHGIIPRAQGSWCQIWQVKLFNSTIVFLLPNGNETVDREQFNKEPFLRNITWGFYGQINACAEPCPWPARLPGGGGRRSPGCAPVPSPFVQSSLARFLSLNFFCSCLNTAYV